MYGGPRGQGAGPAVSRSVRRRDAAAGDREVRSTASASSLRATWTAISPTATATASAIQASAVSMTFIIAGADTSYIVFGGPPLTTVDTPVSMTTLLAQTPKQAVKLNTGSVFARRQQWRRLRRSRRIRDLDLSHARRDVAGPSRRRPRLLRPRARQLQPDGAGPGARAGGFDFGLFVNAGLFENFRSYTVRRHGRYQRRRPQRFCSADGLGGVLHAYLGQNPLPANPPPSTTTRLPSELFAFALTTPLSSAVAEPGGRNLASAITNAHSRR